LKVITEYLEKKCGGMGVEQLKELKRLQKENAPTSEATTPMDQRPIMHKLSWTT